MKFSKQRKQYHQQVLQEVSEMIASRIRANQSTGIASKETHEWASNKVKALFNAKV